jgi:hypothetical protein
MVPSENLLKDIWNQLYSKRWMLLFFRRRPLLSTQKMQEKKSLHAPTPLCTQETLIAVYAPDSYKDVSKTSAQFVSFE